MSAVILRSPDGWAIELLHRPDSVEPVQRYARPDEAVRNRGYGHFCVRVEDLDGAYQQLIAAGAEAVVPPSQAPHPAMRYSYAADPEGNLLEFLQVRAGVDLGAGA
jgi:glyoxylase I family protein